MESKKELDAAKALGRGRAIAGIKSILDNLSEGDAFIFMHHHTNRDGTIDIMSGIQGSDRQIVEMVSGLIKSGQVGLTSVLGNVMRGPSAVVAGTTDLSRETVAELIDRVNADYNKKKKP